MEGPQHWKEADLIIAGDADPCSYGCPHSGCEHEMAMIARAQVHAQLAGTAFIATAEMVRLGALPVSALDAWRDVVAAEDEDEAVYVAAGKE